MSRLDLVATKDRLKGIAFSLNTIVNSKMVKFPLRTSHLSGVTGVTRVTKNCIPLIYIHFIRVTLSHCLVQTKCYAFDRCYKHLAFFAAGSLFTG